MGSVDLPPFLREKAKQKVIQQAKTTETADALPPFLKKKDGGVNYGLQSDQSQSNLSSESLPEKTQPNPQQTLQNEDSVFGLLGKGLNLINSKIVAPVTNALNDAANNIKAQIFKNPDTIAAFKSDVAKHYDDEILKQTKTVESGDFSTGTGVLTDKGLQLIKDKNKHLAEIDNEAEVTIGGKIPQEIQYIDTDGKTKYKTEYVPNDKVLPVTYKPLDPKPDVNIEIGKMGAIGKELMKVTAPKQYEQLEANVTPYLKQQSELMGVTARAKYLDAELLKKGKDIINDPVKLKAFTDYEQGKATPEQIQLLTDSGVKQLYDERNGLSNLATEIIHSNPEIREGALKKAIFNELTNRFGTNKGGLLNFYSKGWNVNQFNKVIDEYKQKLTDPRDIKLLDGIAEQRELGMLVGANQSWAAKMQEQFSGTLDNTAKFISNDLLGVDVPNILDPANADNRNKEQQIRELKQSDADKKNVTIDFKPDKKQFFLKQYVDTNPDSPTFMQTVENKGEMDGSFIDKIAYNSAAQLGQLAAQGFEAGVLPTFGKAGFDLSKATAASEFVENKAANFITKVAMPAYASTFDGNYKQSFDVVGTKDEWKNNLYATLTSSFEGATELLGNPLEQTKFLTSAFKKDIGSFVRGLSFDELQKMGKVEFKDRIKNILTESLKAAGKGGAQMVGEANEEFVNDLATVTTQMVFNPDYTTGSNVLQQAGQTWLQTLASMGFMQVGTVTSARSGWGSKLSQDALTFLAQNKEAAIENTNQQVIDKTLTQQEANEKIHLINTAALAHEQSRQAAIVNAVTTGKKTSNSDLAALTMARSNEIELNNQIKAARETDDVALETSLENKKKQYVELRTSIINDEMWIDPVTGMPEVPPIGIAPEPTGTPESELQPTNEPVTVPKIKAVKGQGEEQAKAFDTHKNEANNWLENENTRLRNIFGKIPFKDFKKEYDTVKETYLQKIGEAVTLSQTKTENDGKNKEANAQTEGRQNEVLTQPEGAVPESIVPSDLKNVENGKEETNTEVIQQPENEGVAIIDGEGSGSQVVPEQTENRGIENAESNKVEQPTIETEVVSTPTNTEASNVVGKEGGSALGDVADNFDTFKEQALQLAVDMKDSSFEWRLTIPEMPQAQREGAVKDIREGKDTPRARKLLAALKDMHDKGVISVNRGRGNAAESIDYPLKDWFENPLTHEELNQSALLDNNAADIIAAEGITENNFDNFKHLFDGFPYTEQDFNEVKNYLNADFGKAERNTYGEQDKGNANAENIGEKSKEPVTEQPVIPEGGEPPMQGSEVKEKKLSDKLRDKAAQIEKEGLESVLPDFLKATLPEGTKKEGFIGGKLLDKAFAEAIRLAANAIDAGSDIAEAIKEGFEPIRKFFEDNTKAFNEAKVLSEYENRMYEVFGEKKPKPRIRVKVGEPEKNEKKEKTDEKRNKTNQLNKLAVDIPGASSVKKYLSGATIKKYTDYDPTNPQEYSSTELEIAFVQGENIIEKAKELFGGKYVSELLDYVERANITNAAKSLIYVSLANDLYKQKKALPDKFEEITKLEFMVNRDAQAFAHDISVALGLRRLQNLQLYGTDTSNIADSILTPTEQEQKAKLEDAVQVDDSDVNKEYEQQQNAEENVTDQTEQADTAKAVEEDKKDKKAKKDTRKKSSKSQWKAVSMSADEIKAKLDEIKNKINKLDC